MPNFVDGNNAQSTAIQWIDDIRNQMPNAMKTRAQGVKWGRRIGVCIGTALEKSMSSKKEIYRQLS
ncbi:MAG TPA: hypothetical protein VFN13_10810 [Rudaea sp.]|nr:hypothetical protein [Rudaea sp.]